METTGIGSESCSIGFCDFLPEPTATVWYTGLYAPQLFDLDFSDFEDALLSQNIFEALDPPLFTSEFFPMFSPGVLLEMPPVQIVDQNTLPIPPAASRTQNTHHQIPPANGAGYSHNGASGSEVWIANGQQSSAVIPAIPQLVPFLPSTTTFPIDWIKVPQRSYEHGRKQWSFKPSEPIPFRTNGRPGISLRDALRKKFADLDGRDDPMLRDARGAVSCRLLFPGYPDNGHSCQIHTLSWTRDRQPIKRSKLAYEVAKKLKQYLNRMAGVAPDGSVEDQWKIGRGFMLFDNMFLVNLVPVSKGSFQPEIWVADPSASRVSANWR